MRSHVFLSSMKTKEKERKRMLVTIADLRPPLFVGMRVSFVPDTLTFSRKHSCLHSCSLGRDTHYSLCSSPLTCRLCPPRRVGTVLLPPVPSRVFHLSNAGCHTSSSECSRTYIHAYIYLVRACVHIPGETLKCAAERANTHACPSRVGRWTPSPSLPLFFCLSPFLTFAFPPAHPLAHSTRVRTLRDVRVCQWNTLSLSGGRQKGGRGREGSRWWNGAG